MEERPIRYLHMMRNVGNWHHYLLHKFGLRRRRRYTFTLRNGMRADVPASTLFTFKEIFFTNDYFDHVPRELLATDNPVVLDIGANVGFFSLRFFAEHPDARIVAVEPIPPNVKQLERNRALNPACDWTLEPAAVASRSGSLSLALNPDDEFTTDATVLDNPRGDAAVEVPALTIEELLGKHGLEQVDYLKLDCEGAEYDILYGCPDAVFTKIRTIVVETHPGRSAEQNKQPLAEHLRSKGYTTHTDSSPFIWAWRR